MYDSACPGPNGRDFAPKTSVLDGKSILVTGGTGSFGRKFVMNALMRHSPRRVVVFSRDELKQFEMRQELTERLGPERMKVVRFFLGDVRDRDQIGRAHV